MDGVLIFADNKVLETGSFENKLFNELRTGLSYSVLPVCNIKDLELTIKAISTFKAIILDWNFDESEEELEGLEGAKLPSKNPEQILNNAEIYSLIYIYSETELAETIKSSLTDRYGTKIKFSKKNSNAIDSELETIKNDINQFEESNKHMEIPFIWSHAINQSVQKIFSELENAEPHWIKEIRETVKIDGGEPTSEIIDIFHHILSESLIQNNDLRTALDNYDCGKDVGVEENTAKLYRRIYYSRILENAPFMTGDIFKFSDEQYGILITPECEVGRRGLLDFLILHEDGFCDFLKNKTGYDKNSVAFSSLSKDKKEKSYRLFNNEELSAHILPSFPFSEEEYNKSAYINFKQAFVTKDKSECKNKRISYKLNAPYIHQLRQRYVAFFGRYGVPAIPLGLKDFNLK